MAQNAHVAKISEMLPRLYQVLDHIIALGNHALERKEYNRVLPKPDIFSKAVGGGGTGTGGGGMKKSTSRGLFSVSSEPVFVRPVYLENEVEEEEEKQPVVAATTTTTAKFADEKESENSSSSSFVGELADIKVEDYENFRPSTRTRQQFHLNHFQCSNLLKLNGFTSSDISKTKKQVSKIRSQRERTKFFVLNYPALNAVEDAFESGARKVKSAVLKAANNKGSGNGSGSGIENNRTDE
ncbi:hypothetical protein FRACYDRAFT_247504 [Fragilariopsis cylindrus CCMP1102]|uniref:Uncharacterized protein n=1 Tax=Fragilariopsis cylindrus CCMP1102 TaxID=635003 RepID=A0A1E7EX72_9STRA|nr:hypothetical protein FRACYDRAFT_247504 [Fragilariopsis cylindrus CCMP1102]|eukprot:OEU10414.1 hypothetical protein FRACYDRAFT_247504 [Fragilariopsis cylindrus CCMP1102]